jgi:serine/threonine protein kinase/Tfp pilus assembly protein PilF
MPEIGQTISHYRIMEKIGQGGMGEVYLAEDLNLNRKVALKFLSPVMLKDESAHKRFIREAQSAAAIDHPYICHINEVGKAEDTDFIVMEYVEGQTLKERLEEGPFTLKEAQRIALEMVEALEEAHKKGIVHRDLKPANIMLTTKGHAKVMDFGLAKQLSPSGGVDSQDETTSAITRAGAVIGTRDYMSPEQLRGHPSDVRSDLYAFGIVYYEMLTGFHPSKQLQSAETLSAIFTNTPTPLLKARRRIPKQIQNILGRLLARDPDQRYRSAQELHIALSKISLDERTGIAGLRFLRPIWLIIPLIVIILVIVPTAWRLLDNYFNSSKAALAFEERDWIIIADFNNLTGEEIFKNSLITAFRIGLEQSRYANVYPESRIAETLKRMKKAGTKNIDASLAQEIALREGIKALVIPSIIGIGDNYRLTASIRVPTSGIDVMVESVEAKGKENIFDALDKLTRRIRTDLGESMEAISQTSKPLVKATTSSLEALSLYTEASNNRNFEDKIEEAAVLFKEALKVDPDFTYARAALGMILYTRLHKQEEGVKLLTEAARNVEDLTEREKLMLLAWHAAYVEQDLENAARYEKTLVTLYPDLSSAHNNLGFSYMELGRYEEAIAEFKEAIRINPNLLVANQNLITIYLYRLGYLNSAVELSKKMIASNPQFPWTHNYLGWAYLGMDDFSGAQAAFEEELKLRPRNIFILWRLAHAQRLQGHYREAITLLNRIMEIDPSQGTNYYLGIIYNHLGENETALKHFERYRQYMEQRIKEDPADGRNYISLALFFAHMGEKERSISLGQKGMAMPPCNATEPFTGEINRYGDLVDLCEFEYATLLSAQGRKQEALDYLELAIRRGYRDYIVIKIVPDLQNLHEEPRFKKLMDEVLHKK